MAGIELDRVSKVYPNGTNAVSAVSLEVRDGEFMVLVGPSGCGKTTVLRMIAGLESISEGTVQVGDEVVNDLPPRERDVAMVFQNYALYPHMTVFGNMAFPLQLKKVDKREISRRVREAADVLGLEDLLDRKPKHLSGGQRQRVAMGRAIVREPHAFLMDEPLSNLDAKLRVQMRAEISRIQDHLGVTTVYVTHDQTEAMTMGDRVAVMKKGIMQQADAPQHLYDDPANLFVAGFIGSPSMNLVEAQLHRDDGALLATFGSTTLTIDDAVVKARPALKRYEGRRAIMGIRPEDIEDASLQTDAPRDRRIESTVDLREALGSDILLHFTVDAPIVLTDDTKELAVDVGTESIESLERHAERGTSTFVARVSPRSEARRKDRVQLAVDTSRVHFFDPETGFGIHDEDTAHE
ncbi:MAG: sn-glycerol-3-phosphate ABC transporter ATP-binding protein UgpC [Actinobacteria bacterium]|nr:MAG: sn-glycerol-3-phosphate ABC transporter ATP-binding protein UgpC [Actinomycetota bacterium]